MNLKQEDPWMLACRDEKGGGVLVSLRELTMDGKLEKAGRDGGAGIGLDSFIFPFKSIIKAN